VYMRRARGYSWNLGLLISQSFIQRILGMAATVLLARSLGAVSFGEYSIVSNTSSTVYGLVRLGVDSALFVSVAESSDSTQSQRQLKEVCIAGSLLLVIVGIIGGAICSLFAGWIAEGVYNDERLSGLIRIAGIMVFLQCLSQFFYAILVGFKYFRQYAQVTIVMAVLNITFLLIAVYFAGLRGAIVVLFCVQGGTTLWYAILVTTVLYKKGMRFRGANVNGVILAAKNLLEVGLPFYLSGLIAIPVVYYLQGMVVSYGGVKELGYLRAVQALVSIVSFAPASVSSVMISMFASVRSTDSAALAHRIMQNIKMMLVFAVVAAGGVTILLPWLIPSLFGANYSAATGDASIALITAIFASVFGVVNNALFSMKKTPLMLLITGIQMAVVFIAGIYLIPKLLLLGYLLADLLGNSLIMVGSFFCWRSWLRMQKVEVAWVAWALLPLSVLAAYSGWQATRVATPSWEEATLALVALGLICVWMLFFVFDSSERASLRRLVSINP
jgi:O-antigen/teichoic acid export membrane protein